MLSDHFSLSLSLSSFPTTTRTREKVSALQEKGIMRAAKDGENIEETLAQGNPVYLENVGRAREVWVTVLKFCFCYKTVGS